MNKKIFSIIIIFIFTISFILPSVDNGVNNLFGFQIFLVGMVSFLAPIYFPCWLSNIAFFIAYSLFRRERFKKAVIFSSYAVVFSILSGILLVTKGLGDFWSKEPPSILHIGYFVWMFSIMLLFLINLAYFLNKNKYQEKINNNNLLEK